MSKTYRVTFTPLEPYFFGNEKSFIYKGQTNSGQFGNKYYIKSELTPSQSTIFGAIRYLMIPNKKNDYSYVPGELDQIIGKASFNIDSKDKHSFGMIECISPIFILDAEADELLIHTPKNHKIKTKSENEEKTNTEFTPFSRYATAKTCEGERLYALDFNTKDGITNSYMYVNSGTIRNNYELFGSTVRVGINRNEKKEGFFKKEFVKMKDGFSFAVFLTLSDDAKIPEMHTSVYLGQNKSLFEVTFTEVTNNTEEDIKKLLSKNVPADSKLVYCAGDAFVSTEVYRDTLFASVTTKTYRSFTTDRGRVTKSSILYNIVSAGSIFIVSTGKTASFKAKIKNEYAEQLGYNKIIIT